MKSKAKLLFYVVLFLMSLILAAGLLRFFGIYVVYSPTDSIKKGYWLFHDCDESELGTKGTYAQFPFDWDGMFVDENVSKYKFLIKEIVGVEGDIVTVGDGVVSVCAGDKIGKCLEYERVWGVPFVDVEGIVAEGEVYVAGKTMNSFDSRYFGAIQKSKLIRCGAPL